MICPQCLPPPPLPRIAPAAAPPAAAAAATGCISLGLGPTSTSDDHEEGTEGGREAEEEEEEANSWKSKPTLDILWAMRRLSSSLGVVKMRREIREIRLE